MESTLFCSVCGLSGFVTFNDLEQHIVQVHVKSRRGRHKCGAIQCGMSFSTNIDYVSHKLDKHKKGMLKDIREDLEAQMQVYNHMNESISNSIALSELSKPSGVKEEPNLIDELAETMHVSPNHTDELILGNSESAAPHPKRLRMEIVKERKLKWTEYGSSLKFSVVDDESNDGSVAAIPGSSNEHSSLTPLNIVPAAPSPKPRSRKQNLKEICDEDKKNTQPQASSSPSMDKD